MLFVNVSERKYDGGEVSLDGFRFVNCFFDGCALLYSGGPVTMENCRFRNCEVRMQGSAAIVVESLRRMGFEVSAPDEISPISETVH